MNAVIFQVRFLREIYKSFHYGHTLSELIAIMKIGSQLWKLPYARIMI